MRFFFDVNRFILAKCCLYALYSNNKNCFLMFGDVDVLFNTLVNREN